MDPKITLLFMLIGSVIGLSRLSDVIWTACGASWRTGNGVNFCPNGARFRQT